MEYVQERASLYELTKAVKAWERKVEISEVSHMTRHLEKHYDSAIVSLSDFAIACYNG